LGIDVVKAMFPKVSAVNILEYFALIDKALDEQIKKHRIQDSQSIVKLKLYSYATIRVENGSRLLDDFGIRDPRHCN